MDICKGSNGIYFTDCDNAWEFMNGNIQNNKVIFCPYCGKLIKTKELNNGKQT